MAVQSDNATPRATACSVHYLLLQKVTSPRSTILNAAEPWRHRLGVVRVRREGDLEAVAVRVRVHLRRAAAPQHPSADQTRLITVYFRKYKFHVSLL